MKIKTVTNFKWHDRIKFWLHCLIMLHQEVLIWEEPITFLGIVVKSKSKHIGCFQCDKANLDDLQVKLYGEVLFK